MTHALPTIAPAAAPNRPPLRERAWLVWGIAAGALGFVATGLLDVRPQGELDAMAEGRDYLVTPADMADLDRFGNYLGFLLGFAAVAALLVFHAAWRTHVEPSLPRSVAARVVSAGLVVSAAGLTFGYAGKGALGNYGPGGHEADSVDQNGLYVYFMLTDFGPYIPWYGVLVSLAGIGWLAWADRAISRIPGTIALVLVAAVAVAYVLTGVVGLAAIVAGPGLVLVCAWILLGRTPIGARASLAS